MLKNNFIQDIYDQAQNYLNKDIKICGWVSNIRDLGGVKFVLLRDRTGILQLVFKKGITPDEEIMKSKDLVKESVICIDGVLTEGKSSLKYEVQVKKLNILNKPYEPIPLDPDTSTDAQINVRLDYRWLDVRNRKISSIFVFESWVAKNFRDYLTEKGFVEIFTPKIVSTGTEGGAEVFPVIYFGKEAYLAQSPQFYKQLAVISGLERVFEIGPVFRAEASHTVRHLAEFHGLDFEMGYINNVNDVMDTVEGFFRRMVEKSKKDELIKQVREFFSLDVSIPEKVPRIPIREAYKILEKYDKHLPYGSDLDTESERILGEYAKKEYNSDFVFVTEYPWKVRPFYTMRKEDDDQWTYGFDLLFRGLEVATGSQREHRYDMLIKNLKDKGLDDKKFKFYLDFFKDGTPPHGGVGLGLERIVKQFLNLDNVREARFLPRDTERITP
ncbi:aspartyl-tRNA synthetase, archaeal type [Caldisphaera lagunensis DSM 15908]|uniref:Aspartate--tRNA ligase n=1 Tax=Caldisphaera lagunensis (strain DSM 15908 / JCM 11604 / ANMR 0165 / IC-154) TaxID=1056495 RepID=L0ADX1_CALLD|nr:aspartate--tRNA(Asn) ligase [Caldisphaera lagunensis]AFZ71250.1 aspartyl-tRNA synthetase, archaeal type [Caldisphaera lagunensis DSM 15908]